MVRLCANHSKGRRQALQPRSHTSRGHRLAGRLLAVAALTLCTLLVAPLARADEAGERPAPAAEMTAGGETSQLSLYVALAAAGLLCAGVARRVVASRRVVDLREPAAGAATGAVDQPASS